RADADAVDAIGLVLQAAPADIGVADAGTDIGRHADEGAEVEIAVCHDTDCGELAAVLGAAAGARIGRVDDRIDAGQSAAGGAGEAGPEALHGGVGAEPA